VKVTLKGRLCPAVITAGSDNPPMVKSELLEVTDLTVTFAPLAFRLPEALPVEPTKTLPNVRLEGVAPNTAGTVVPLPARDKIRLGFDPLDVMVTLPLAVPAD
jgi:hypothetical protein